MFRIALFILLILSVFACAYLDRTNIISIDIGLGSSLDPGGRVFGEYYRQEWAFRSSLSYGISERISIGMRATSLAQKPKDDFVLKLAQGQDPTATSPLRDDYRFDPGYSQIDLGAVAKYHFNIGEIYAPVVELGGGVGRVNLKGNQDWHPFANLAVGHEFFIRPGLALDILGDVHIFFHKIEPIMSDKEEQLILLAATAGLRWYL